MSPLGERLAWIITTLVAAIGTYGRRIASPPQPVWLGTKCFMPAIAQERLPPLPAHLWTLFHARITRTARRFQALYDAWRAGTLVPPRPPRPPAQHQAAKRTPTPAPRLPRSFAWLNLRARETAPVAGMLHMLLHEAPDARRFLTEVPRAARLIRPLCQALGVPQPEWLALPRKPRPPRPRPPRATPPPTTDRPLQPYVRAAVRAWKKTYG